MGRFRPRWPSWLRRRDAHDVESMLALVRPLCDEFPATPYLAGWCNVCGEATAFFCADITTARESLVCAHCRCTSRYRAVARGLLRAFRERLGIAAESLAALAAAAPRDRIAVYDTQAPFRASRGAYPLPEYLARLPWIDLHLSLFKPALARGSEIAPGVTNQDLEALTFPDGTFDVVITSDVMEHVRLAGRAHREIRRVLRPGGVYLFTVPHDRARAATLERVRIVDPDDPTRDEHLLEPEYHGDANAPENRALAYRLYGRDLDDELRALGFAVEYLRADDPRHGIVSSELFWCPVVGAPVPPVEGSGRP